MIGNFCIVQFSGAHKLTVFVHRQREINTHKEINRQTEREGKGAERKREDGERNRERGWIEEEREGMDRGIESEWTEVHRERGWIEE